MKKEYISTLLASALGAVVGILGLYHYGPWKFLGLPVGALVGYLLFNPQQILKGLKYAWLKTVSGVRASLVFPSRDFWEVAGWSVLGTLGIMATFCTPYLFLEGGIFENPALHDFLGFLTLGCAVFIQMVVWSSYTFEGADEARKHSYEIFIVFNPFGACILLCGIIFLVMGKIIEKSWWLAHTGAKFFKTFFVFVHSQGRLLCAIDSTLGALAGFVVDYEGPGVVVAALVGGLCGLVHAWFAQQIIDRLASAKA